ncbi:SDR family oxidoreductase [Bradyrhizobium sp. C9]|uniref:UDP-glucose 4-epimerase family protein n=1 Tax=Bradyrhizobium sp. C9 TaxID=142585 RepID=UPI000BE8C289|nr:SDR family oxidoreductase [Bradyrhizobium sp. C9]PDT74082.1 UDP-glucose 4-epimerase [Bradyrhizobium sp. C9]
MNILITGATGFVGLPLLGALGLRGYRTIPVVRRSVGLSDEMLVPEISAQTDFQGALSGCNTVVHLAARVHVMRDQIADPLSEFRRVNVEGTLNLARQAVAAGVRRFVFVSSIKVNGESGSQREDATPAPKDPYGISKMEAEQGLMTIARETTMEVVIIRPPLVYGPGVKGNFATMVKWVQKGIPLPLGAVNNRRSLLALDNLIDFIALCVDRDRSPRGANEVFLISDGDDVSTADLLRRVAKAYDVKARLMPIPAGWLKLVAHMAGKTEAADRLLGSLVVDSVKARELLGWQPVVSMDNQLQKMALLEV